MQRCRRRGCGPPVRTSTRPSPHPTAARCGRTRRCPGGDPFLGRNGGGIRRQLGGTRRRQSLRSRENISRGVVWRMRAQRRRGGAGAGARAGGIGVPRHAPPHPTPPHPTPPPRTMGWKATRPSRSVCPSSVRSSFPSPLHSRAVASVAPVASAGALSMRPEVEASGCQARPVTRSACACKGAHAHVGGGRVGGAGCAPRPSGAGR